VEQDVPYFRLSAFYLFYFASIGIFMPYWSVYLQSLNFSPAQIGELFAIPLATKIYAPYLWGWLADRSGRHLTIIRWTTFAAMLAFMLVVSSKTFLSLAITLSIYSFFWHAALPQFEAVTINHLGERRERYSRIRLWGSVGFIIAVTGIGYWLEHSGISVLPWVLLVALIGIWLASMLIPPVRESGGHQPHVSAIRQLRHPAVLGFLVACFLMQASHGPYYAFLSIYLKDHGYSATAIGQLWALGVVAEIGVFLLVHRWLLQVGAVRLFQLAILITAVRWVLLAEYVDVLSILLLTQTLHAASYGLFHASGIQLVNHFFPGKLQGRGQALYASLSFGLGNALGSLASGYLWTDTSPETTYLIASVTCLAGFIVTLMFLPHRIAKL
jgi:PPP family 3-phenylpropionic acid transporter